MGPLLIPLIGAGLAAGGALGGAIGSGANMRKLKNTGEAYYDYARGVARQEQYNSIFDSAYGKSLLKLQDMRDKKDLDAVQNRAIAGGATVENQLAARQSINENRDRTNMQLIQYDDRNRRAWKEKDLDLAGQQANFRMNNYRQAAQDWNQWGGQMAQAGMSLMSSGLLNGMGGLGGAASSLVGAADVAGSGANTFNAAVAASQSPSINYGAIPAPPEGTLGDLTRHWTV